MTGSLVRALGLAAVLAVAVTGVALAANSGGYSDTTADSSTAPDLSEVSITNDDAGVVTVRVAFANRSLLSPSEGVGIGLDIDQNPDTGSVYYGTEWEFFAINGNTVVFRETAAGGESQVAAPASLVFTAAPGTATFSFRTSDLGIAAGFKLYTLSANDDTIDLAPDIRMYNYQLAAGTAAPLLGRDTRPPVTEAIKSSGTHGKLTDINYFAADGRAETADAIVVYRGKKAIKRFNFPLGDTNPFFVYSARWKVPKKTKGKFRFCVTSTDRAGNKSKASCAALTIK